MEGARAASSAGYGWSVSGRQARHTRSTGRWAGSPWSRGQGRTKTFYARAAIEAHLDDLEDFYLAEERLRDFRDGDAIPLAALKAELGLED